MVRDPQPTAGVPILSSAESEEPAPFEQDPIYDRISVRRLELLKSTVCRGADEDKIASFLELAWHYDLDPFAGEIWLVVGKPKPGRDGGSSGPAKTYIMIGRNGLRKIAAKNGLALWADVIHANDQLEVSFTAGEHRVMHSYGKPGEERGPIVGAWAQVTHIKSGMERGWFMADINEYRPTNANQLAYSPWGSQESVMVLGAAERTALRQAVPLGGLLTEGEVQKGEEVAEAADSDLSYLEVEATEPSHTPELPPGQSAANVTLPVPNEAAREAVRKLRDK
jgi:hypothetical protein